MKEKVIYALGFFDGVHLGHQALLSACRELAQRHGCKAGAVTFTSHPDALVTGKTPPLIDTDLQRQQLLSAYGTKNILALSFDEALKNTPWEDFLEFLLQKGAAGFVCGEDFRFGHRGEGTAQKLADFCRKKGLPWAVVPAQTLDGIRISSTHIRSLIEAGDMETAGRFLGHAHALTGVVRHGRELGRTIGIPTANLTIPEGVIVPKFGVYATQILLNGSCYNAVTNVGTRPTVDGNGVTVESWLLDYSGDLYGKHLTVFFHQFLRPEQKFPRLEDLQAQIRKDAEKVREIFEKT